MASEFDTVVVEIRGMERLEAAIEKFVQALNGFGRMTEKAAPEIDAVIQAMDGIGLEELSDPAGAERRWPDAAARASVMGWDDGATVHLPPTPSRPLSDDEPLTAPPFFGHENR